MSEAQNIDVVIDNTAKNRSAPGVR